jgi:tetratricopeptide (TPR) repeat protein
LTEFKKGFVVAGYEQPTLQKNVAALYAAHGDFKDAQEHAKKALDLNPSDGSNHRNISKLLDQMGDQISALKHNKEAITLDLKQGKPPNPRSYRAAAVQNFVKAGSLDESISLIRQARIIEHKKYECPTTQRTGEIIAKIMKRVGDPLNELEKAEKELHEKKALEEAIMNGAVKHTLTKLHRAGKYTRENG